MCMYSVHGMDSNYVQDILACNPIKILNYTSKDKLTSSLRKSWHVPFPHHPRCTVMHLNWSPSIKFEMLSSSKGFTKLLYIRCISTLWYFLHTCVLFSMKFLEFFMCWRIAWITFLHWLQMAVVSVYQKNKEYLFLNFCHCWLSFMFPLTMKNWLSS